MLPPISGGGGHRRYRSRLPRPDTSRLRATWLADCAELLGLATFMHSLVGAGRIRPLARPAGRSAGTWRGRSGRPCRRGTASRTGAGSGPAPRTAARRARRPGGSGPLPARVPLGQCVPGGHARADRPGPCRLSGQRAQLPRPGPRRGPGRRERPDRGRSGGLRWRVRSLNLDQLSAGFHWCHLPAVTGIARPSR